MSHYPAPRTRLALGAVAMAGTAGYVRNRGARRMADDTITVYGTAWCGDCRRARKLLDRHGARYRWIDIDADSDAQAVVLRLNRGQRSVPTILFPDGTLLVEPADRALAAKLAPAAPGTAASPDEPWRGQALAAGLLGSLIASLCCLPVAAALALGVGPGTAATFGRLLAFQAAFLVAGSLLAGLAAWRIAGRGGTARALYPTRRAGGPLVVFAAFIVGYALVTRAFIPFLEHLPWVLAGK